MYFVVRARCRRTKFTFAVLSHDELVVTKENDHYAVNKQIDRQTRTKLSHETLL